MQKKHLVTAAAIGIVLIAVGIFLKKGPAAVSGDPSQMGDATQNSDSESADGQENIDISGLNKAGPEVTGKTNLAAAAPQVAWTPEVKAQLKAFQALQSKSVMTPKEEEDRLKMLQDGDLISKLSAALRSRVAQQDPQFEENQNISIDLLVEALKGGNEQAAIDAIWEQIRDGQVEDANVPLKQREVLGGIKGELLYHATALRPDAFQDIEIDLPGPASQKIWKNVQGQHQINLDSSQAEIEERERKLNQPEDPADD
jgi:hypothetical protein